MPFPSLVRPPTDSPSYLTTACAAEMFPEILDEGWSERLGRGKERALRDELQPLTGDGHGPAPAGPWAFRWSESVKTPQHKKARCSHPLLETESASFEIILPKFNRDPAATQPLS